jgi:hypothetical protein
MEQTTDTINAIQGRGGLVLGAFVLIGALSGITSLYRLGPEYPENVLFIGTILNGILGGLLLIFFISGANSLPSGGTNTLFTLLITAFIVSVLNTTSYANLHTPGVSAWILPFVIVAFIAAMFMIFVGSIGGKSNIYFYIGMILLVSLYILYAATSSGATGFQTPGKPVPSSSPYYGGAEGRSVYDMDKNAKETDPNSRTLADLAYLTVAYPTFNDADKIPVPNTTDVYGSHSLANYQNTLNAGASAVYLDIYFQDQNVALDGGSSTPSTLNTWRVGTLNTITGLVQNRRTISLASVLDATQRTIDMNRGTTGKTYFVILNPRYTSSQMKDGTNNAENILAKTIQDTVKSCGLPPMSQNKSNASQGISETRLNQARDQVVFILGGVRPPTSQSLRNTIQGTIDLQDTYIRTTASSPGTPETALAYTPGVSKVPFDAPTVLCTNSANADSVLVSQNRSKDSVANGTTSMPQLCMVFPNDCDATRGLYEDSNLPHIRFGASFPVVFPAALGRGYSQNANVLNGYSFEATRNSSKIRSYVWDNSIDADTNPQAESFLSLIQHCGNTTANPVNPMLKGSGTSSAWTDILGNRIQPTRWCDTLESHKTMTYLARPLVLYHPASVVNIMNTAMTRAKVGKTYNIRGKTPVPGYAVKPAVLDHWGPSGRNGIYILRSIVTHGNVMASKLD